MVGMGQSGIQYRFHIPKGEGYDGSVELSAEKR